MLFLKRKNEKERRKYPRINTRNLLAIQLTERTIFNLVDISENGLQFSSPRNFKRKEILKLSVNLAEADIQIPALSQVVWIRPIFYKKVEVFRIGVTFLELSQQAVQVLRQYVMPSLRAA